MEFEITSSLDTIRNQSITANFEAVAAWLDEELAPYMAMVVTDEMIPTAKTYRANLRKVKDRIEQYRKEAKNAAMAPYNAFEEKCKVLTGKLDAAAGNLDGQIKEAENREKTAKAEELKAAYDAYGNDEVKRFAEWEQVFDSRWLNKGFSVENAKKEIAAYLDGTEKDIDTIRDMGGNDTPYLLDIYKNTHELSAVVRKASELAAMRKREEQRKAETSAPVVTAKAEPAESDPVVSTAFKVTCPRSKLVALGQYMKLNGIQFSRV